MTLAPDAVQNVEATQLTGGYKNKFPLFHNVFHVCVEMPSQHRVILITKLSNKKTAPLGGFSKT
jgi:hypothetical protein